MAMIAFAFLISGGVIGAGSVVAVLRTNKDIFYLGFVSSVILMAIGGGFVAYA